MDKEAEVDVPLLSFGKDKMRQHPGGWPRGWGGGPELRWGLGPQDKFLCEGGSDSGPHLGAATDVGKTTHTERTRSGP